MKYTEYLQFRELLEQNGITLEEFKKDPVLYEGILGKIGSGLWNLAKMGMKKAVSAGLQPAYKDKLNKKAEQVKDWILKEIEKGKTEENHPLYTTFKERRKYIPDEKNPIELNASKKRIVRQIDREISAFIRKSVDRQIKRIEQNVNKNKFLDDIGKENVLDYWDDLGLQIEVSIGAALREAGIMTEDSFSDYIEQIKVEHESDLLKPTSRTPKKGKNQVIQKNN
jgi:hypothetical protein